jgi:hypothetical protein
MQEETEFLGHTISKDGISTAAGLVKAIQEWPWPTSIKHVFPWGRWQIRGVQFVLQRSVIFLCW